MTGVLKNTLNIAGSVASIIVVIMLPWVIGIDRRVTTIEASMFTMVDGRDLWEKISNLPGGTPPTWFLQRVDRLEEKIDKLADFIQGERESQK